MGALGDEKQVGVFEGAPEAIGEVAQDDQGRAVDAIVAINIDLVILGEE